MSRPPDDRPTTVIPQQTVEQPAMTTAPATRRSRLWPRQIPARIGRARSSTVVIGCLFVLLGGLDVVLPDDPYVTVPTQYGDLRVRQSQLTVTPTTTPAQTSSPVPTDDTPATTTPATSTSRAPETTADEDDEDTRTTAPQSTTPSRSQTSSPATTSSRSTTSRAPSTTATDDETPVETSSPTS